MAFLWYSVYLYKNWDIKWEITSFSTFWNGSFAVCDLDLHIWFYWSVLCFASLNDMLLFSTVAMVFLSYSVNLYRNWDKNEKIQVFSCLEIGALHNLTLTFQILISPPSFFYIIYFGILLVITILVAFWTSSGKLTKTCSGERQNPNFSTFWNWSFVLDPDFHICIYWSFFFFFFLLHEMIFCTFQI